MKKPMALLTIDDGPSNGRKDKVDFLAKNNISPIWFCEGKKIQDNWAETIYSLKKGGEIGNHAFSHRAFSSLAIEQCIEEIILTDDIINNIYMEAGITRYIYAFRFPFGDKGFGFDPIKKGVQNKNHEKKVIIQNLLHDLGYSQQLRPQISYKYFCDAGLDEDKDYYWTYDVKEWCLHSSEKDKDQMQKDDIWNLMNLNSPENLLGLNNSESDDIIVLHDHDETNELFNEMIQRLKRKVNFYSIQKDQLSFKD